MKGCSAAIVQLAILAVFVYFGWRYGVQHGGEVLKYNPVAAKLFRSGFGFGLASVLAFNLGMFGFRSLVRGQREG